MHDRPSDLARRRLATALARLDDFVALNLRGERLPPHVVERYGRHRFHTGWRVRVDFADLARELHLLVDDGLPYSVPRIALAEGPGVLAWPHLEDNRLLCTLPTGAAVSTEHPVHVVKHILGAACRLIEECVGGRNTDDFRTEFLSYWAAAVDTTAVGFISLIAPRGPGRRVFIWRGRSMSVVGDEGEALKQWLGRWSVTSGGLNYRLRDGVLIWLPEPLLPVDYPRSAADVLALAKKRSPEAAVVLEELAVANTHGIDVFLGAPSLNGACFGALRIHPGGRKVEAGFRPGHAPRPLLVKRRLGSGFKVTKSIVKRADHEWIHGRDQDHQIQDMLKKRRVAVVGIGSVGGSVARLLAQSGIGNLLLIDPGVMEWPNIGRHELGAASVERNKARALMEQIKQSFPHIDVSCRTDRFRPPARSLLSELASCDLIVSATGDWAAEGFLNDVQHGAKGFPAVLYAWVEPHAAAAHAVLIIGDHACLRCGVDAQGRPHLAVTEWAEGHDIRREPACGAVFTPYGPVELCHAHGLVAEYAIAALTGDVTATGHRIWISRRSRVVAAGGAWSDKWITEVGDPGEGGTIHERRWPAAVACPVCTRREQAA